MNSTIKRLGQFSSVTPDMLPLNMAVLRTDIVSLNGEKITDGYHNGNCIMYYYKSWSLKEGEDWSNFVIRTHKEFSEIFNQYRHLSEKNENIGFLTLYVNEQDYRHPIPPDFLDSKYYACEDLNEFRDAFMIWHFKYFNYYNEYPHAIDFPCWEKCQSYLANYGERLIDIKKEELRPLLFLINNDWENQYILHTVHHLSEFLITLAKESLLTPFDDAKQQLAFELGNLPSSYDVNSLLYEYLKSTDSLVIRKSLLALHKRKDDNLIYIVYEKFELDDIYVKLTCLIILNEINESDFETYFHKALSIEQNDMRMLLEKYFPDK
ncbi:MAG: hypothetical protein H9534_03795 [Dolichospermum circinale Clear-D4]|nr:hypothetical protein [Dolichospermum circinale Clear-D4]